MMLGCAFQPITSHTSAHLALVSGGLEPSLSRASVGSGLVDSRGGPKGVVRNRNLPFKKYVTLGHTEESPLTSASSNLGDSEREEFTHISAKRIGDTNQKIKEEAKT